MRIDLLPDVRLLALGISSFASPLLRTRADAAGARRVPAAAVALSRVACLKNDLLDTPDCPWSSSPSSSRKFNVLMVVLPRWSGPRGPAGRHSSVLPASNTA